MREMLDETKYLYNILLRDIQNSPHHVKPSQRLAIYKSFGYSGYANGHKQKVQQLKTDALFLSEADRAVAWLSIITASKLDAVWKQASFDIDNTNTHYSYNPYVILKEAKKFLTGKQTASKAFSNLTVNFDQAVGGLDVSAKLLCAIYTSYNALEITLLGTDILLFEAQKNNFDDAADAITSDFAEMAVKAYTTINEDKPLIYDSQKRLEFWEWWLTEAIPQAWELAQETYRPQ